MCKNEPRPYAPGVTRLNDRDCVALLQWAAPRLGLRFRGFTNVRRQVCRRIAERTRELGLDAEGYRARLEDDAAELRVLDGLCYVTISRFYRDRSVYEALRRDLLPSLAEIATRRGDGALRIWSAGCASGEEPYTLAILWRAELAERFAHLPLEIMATDRDEVVLARARRGEYQASSLRELPAELRDVAFESVDGGALHRVRDVYRRDVVYARGDVRDFTPDAPLHLVMCRNLVFTYLDEDAQRAFLGRLTERLVPGGLLVVGSHETVPEGFLTTHPTVPWVFVRRESSP